MRSCQENIQRFSILSAVLICVTVGDLHIGTRTDKRQARGTRIKRRRVTENDAGEIPYKCWFGWHRHTYPAIYPTVRGQGVTGQRYRL